MPLSFFPFYLKAKKEKKYLWIRNKKSNFVPDYSATGSFKSSLSDLKTTRRS
ncbi:hypothetical protein HMPREF1981_00413 [Bacteroides pyogenes F0041]|uniref:Uncharacterized protein n=1 Tax=Bacteroides pyogenes F0041 TaxID=1321819 RepID=U2CX42_9BACE|nr:hypothetical protein HMPREF1981_00413 [Bacteroides pyogenes F0041]GAE22801.1 hypothetical protein JCM10003_2458 [Bacteroides pyogenes JCM 10003]